MRKSQGIARAFIAMALALAAGVSPRADTVDQPQDVLYVCVQDEAKIAVVDMAKAEVVRTIDLTALGYPATAKPHYIVVEPGGAHWYVSLIGANRVVKFDRAGKRLLGFLVAGEQLV